MSAVSPERVEMLRGRVGRVGVWLGSIGQLPADEERAAVSLFEQLGYGTVWFGEGPANREALSHAALLLGAGERVMVASGIANIWVRDAAAAINGANTLDEAYGERFVLGLGVSHAPIVNSRGNHMALYLTLPNYVENLRTLGFGEEDFADGGSDRLVDAIVAWGDEERIAARVREHLDAGADHVAVQACAADAQSAVADLRRLAPALAGL